MIKEPLKIEGFSRVRILTNGKIVGDSGWTGPNAITNLGFKYYLCCALGGYASSAQVGYAVLGEGTAPGVTDTTLENECSGVGTVPIRVAVTAVTSGNHTMQFTVTFNSTHSFVTATESIQNIGLHAVSYHSATVGSLFCGNTFTASSCASNQDVNATFVKKGHLLVIIRSKLLKFRETLNRIKTILSQAFNEEGATTRGVAPIFCRVKV